MTATTTAAVSPTATSAAVPTGSSLPISGPWVSITSGDYPRDDAGWAYGPMPAPGITAYRQKPDGFGGCTISFPVIDSKGTVAFLSAGHCDDQRDGS